MSCDNQAGTLAIIVSSEKSITFFKTYSPKETEYLLNTYDSQDRLDYSTSNYDLQYLCQMLKLYHRLVDNYDKYLMLGQVVWNENTPFSRMKLTLKVTRSTDNYI